MKNKVGAQKGAFIKMKQENMYIYQWLDGLCYVPIIAPVKSTTYVAPFFVEIPEFSLAYLLAYLFSKVWLVAERRERLVGCWTLNPLRFCQLPAVTRYNTPHGRVSCAMNELV
ncbi:MAG: hypothetical protein E7I42_15080 [Pluralibacter gergoviae]|nr:hypothetical protein [Pluralibacter gergoviae]